MGMVLFPPMVLEARGHDSRLAGRYSRSHERSSFFALRPAAGAHRGSDA
jgi:hypothetical protein